MLKKNKFLIILLTVIFIMVFLVNINIYAQKNESKFNDYTVNGYEWQELDRRVKNGIIIGFLCYVNQLNYENDEEMFTFDMGTADIFTSLIDELYEDGKYSLDTGVTVIFFGNTPF